MVISNHAPDCLAWQRIPPRLETRFQQMDEDMRTRATPYLVKKYGRDDVILYRRYRHTDARLPSRDEIARQNLGRFLGVLSERYRSCCFDTYHKNCDAQTQAVSVASDYLERAIVRKRNGNLGGEGMLLFGPSGTGKDHLAIAVVRELAKENVNVIYKSGSDLFDELRSAVGEGRVPQRRQRYVDAELLYLSDPLTVSGSLSEFLQEALAAIIEKRYERCLPTIVTCNVNSRHELNDRMGAKTADRLCDGATVVPCNWASARRARNSNLTVTATKPAHAVGA